EGKLADRALHPGAGSALGHLLDVELVRHLVRGDELEELALARVGQRHPQVLGAGDAEHAFLNGEDVGFKELPVGVVKDVGNLERRPVLEPRSEEHTSELQSLAYLVCRLLLEKKKKLTRLPRR